MNLSKKKFAAALVAAAFFLLASVQLRGGKTQPQSQTQSQAQTSSGKGAMNTPSMRREMADNPTAARMAHRDMSSMDMGANPHMFMTSLRSPNLADQARAAQVLATLRPAIEKYKDYHVALADGFQIFLPNIPQKQYHFTNWRYAVEAMFTFDPAHPTSLLYDKLPGGYKLVGAMYTAPRRFTEEQLNARVPLSVGRWHKHVNFCMPQKGTPTAQVNWKKFGLVGSISTEPACQEAGGRWVPEIFNWMVHVYPYEADPQKIWAH